MGAFFDKKSFAEMAENLAAVFVADADNDAEGRHACCLICVEVGVRMANLMSMFALAAWEPTIGAALGARFIQLLQTNDWLGLRNFIFGLQNIDEAGMQRALDELDSGPVSEITALVEQMKKPVS